MRLFFIPLALAAAACATAPDEPSGTCDADRLGDLVGREATAELGAEAMRRSGARTLRWIRPGDAVTMDFSPNRLNLNLDAQGRLERATCG
jgi:hypothetical protein